VCAYVETRLTRLEETVRKPEAWLDHDLQFERSLQGVNMWRSQITIWKEMVHDTLEVALPAAKRLVRNKDGPKNKHLVDITSDFERVQNLLKESEGRLDSLSDKSSADMQLRAAGQSLAESRNMKKLTWLASLFLPLSFVTGFFSLNGDVKSLTGTFKFYYPAVAIPVLVVSFVVVLYGPRFFKMVGEHVWSPVVGTVKDHVWSPLVERVKTTFGKSEKNVE
jgi:Mg2+ and Co2+ transporter CorA